MRVIAGKARSLPLKAPEGAFTRPTTDRIKETLFNMLQPYLTDCIFADLFSGSGGIGIEAISRGAARCYFVENDSRAMRCIQKNVAFTKFTEEAVLLKQDAVSGLGAVREALDVVFMDPPYDSDCEKRILTHMKGMPCITEDTLIVVEASLHTDFSYVEELGFTVMKEKKYKTNKHVFIQRRV